MTDNVHFAIALNVAAERRGNIVFKTVGDYIMSKTVEIVQEGVKTTLEVEQDEYIIPYKCKALTIPVTQEYAIEYTMTSTEPWITLDKEASTEDAIVLKIQDNTDRFPRTSSVTIKNSVLEQKIEIFSMVNLIRVLVTTHRPDNFWLSPVRREVDVLQPEAVAVKSIGSLIWKIMAK